MFRTIVRTGAVASCLVLTASACSKKVDSSSVEKQVVTNVESVFPDVKDVSADCPSNVKAQKGKKFSCKLTLDGRVTYIRIEIKKVEGKRFTFDLKPTKAIIPITTYEKKLAEQGGAGTKVDCGDDKLLFKDPGDTITCKVTVKGQTQQLKLRVKDVKGNLEPVK